MKKLSASYKDDFVICFNGVPWRNELLLVKLKYKNIKSKKPKVETQELWGTCNIFKILYLRIAIFSWIGWHYLLLTFWNESTWNFYFLICKVNMSLKLQYHCTISLDWLKCSFNVIIIVSRTYTHHASSKQMALHDYKYRWLVCLNQYSSKQYCSYSLLHSHKCVQRLLSKAFY